MNSSIDPDIQSCLDLHYPGSVVDNVYDALFQEKIVTCVALSDGPTLLDQPRDFVLRDGDKMVRVYPPLFKLDHPQNVREMREMKLSEVYKNEYPAMRKYIEERYQGWFDTHSNLVTVGLDHKIQHGQVIPTLSIVFVVRHKGYVPLNEFGFKQSDHPWPIDVTMCHYGCRTWDRPAAPDRPERPVHVRSVLVLPSTENMVQWFRKCAGLYASVDVNVEQILQSHPNETEYVLFDRLALLFAMRKITKVAPWLQPLLGMFEHNLDMGIPEDTELSNQVNTLISNFFSSSGSDEMIKGVRDVTNTLKSFGAAPTLTTALDNTLARDLNIPNVPFSPIPLAQAAQRIRFLRLGQNDNTLPPPQNDQNDQNDQNE